jgi:hypothetical protein|tara:strand:- start:556 stop:939 length:384 start_codon:yes stop_codon:yes gene_type:complete
MYEKFNISLRLNLDDILGDSEDLVLSSLSMAEKNINGTNIFKFSYSKSEPTKVVEYAKKLDSLSSNVIIRAEDAIGFDDYVLFDVYNHKKVNSRSRFQMRAKTIDDILIGIREFVKISNFILSVNDR